MNTEFINKAVNFCMLTYYSFYRNRHNKYLTLQNHLLTSYKLTDAQIIWANLQMNTKYPTAIHQNHSTQRTRSFYQLQVLKTLPFRKKKSQHFSYQILCIETRWKKKNTVLFNFLFAHEKKSTQCYSVKGAEEMIVQDWGKNI